MRNTLHMYCVALLAGVLLALTSVPGLADGEPKAPAPTGSILDSIDDVNFPRNPAPIPNPAAACPACIVLANRLPAEQAKLIRTRDYLDKIRKQYTELTVGGRAEQFESKHGRESINDLPFIISWYEKRISDVMWEVEVAEREVETLRRQLEECNKRCAPRPPGPGTQRTNCPPCVPMGLRLDELKQGREAKEAEIERLSREAQEISGRAMEGKAQPGDGSQLQERRRRIEALSNEIDGITRESEGLAREMKECERKRCPPPEPVAEPPKQVDARKDATIRKDSQVGPAGGGVGGSGGGGCYFQPAKPVTIGPREQFGYGDEQKAGEVGKAALSILGGFLGGRGGGGGGRGSGPVSPPGGDKPRLADDPIRDKQTFADPQTGTAIQVGAQYRPDGKLLVSVGVDKAEDQGVVHQAAMERLQYLPSGGCAVQVAEPVEWLHYEIWEDWWAKIRIQRYESVDGGPWRKTHDTGWRDWGSGTRLLESGTMRADQIPRTAWGSMGADRAFGGPRAAGALFDPGKPAVTGQPAAERLVVHVSQPGKDPVTTIPFTLYPTYGTDGKVNYTDQAPDWEAMHRMRTQRVPDKMGGGMQQIDPPVTGAAPRESIFDSIDSGVGKTPLAK